MGEGQDPRFGPAALNEVFVLEAADLTRALGFGPRRRLSLQLSNGKLLLDRVYTSK